MSYIQALGADVVAAAASKVSPEKKSDGGFWSDIWGGTKSVLSEGRDLYKQKLAQEGKLSVYGPALTPGTSAPSQTPAWLLPVGLGAAALVLVVALKRKG